MSARTHRKNSYALPFATRAHESILLIYKKTLKHIKTDLALRQLGWDPVWGMFTFHVLKILLKKIKFFYFFIHFKLMFLFLSIFI